MTSDAAKRLCSLIPTCNLRSASSFVSISAPPLSSATARIGASRSVAVGTEVNPYDGHTLEACIEQAQRVSGTQPEEAYADRGYRGHGCDSSTLKVWIAGAKRRVTAAIHRKLKRRNAVEPVIGHMKSDGRLARNFLQGIEGDAMNALLCGAGHNMRKLPQEAAASLRSIGHHAAAAIEQRNLLGRPQDTSGHLKIEFLRGDSLAARIENS